MKISYLITCSNETNTLTCLLKAINHVIGSDEIVILMDEKYMDNKTHDIVAGFHHMFPCRILKHPLNNDYGTHKNFGIEHCNGDFIFQIDGDEMPPDSLLGENLHALLENNPNIEAYAVPRINAWQGLTPEIAKEWGWNLDMSPTHNRLRAAWPDYQWRLFKNTPSIRFKNRLHERIDGFKSYVGLPTDEEWALDHIKTIETQIATNLRYNKDFTNEENKGISDKK